MSSCLKGANVQAWRRAFGTRNGSVLILSFCTSIPNQGFLRHDVIGNKSDTRFVRDIYLGLPLAGGDDALSLDDKVVAVNNNLKIGKHTKSDV
jgi:hypothetical protein